MPTALTSRKIAKRGFCFAGFPAKQNRFLQGPKGGNGQVFTETTKNGAKFWSVFLHLASLFPLINERISTIIYNEAYIGISFRDLTESMQTRKEYAHWR